MSVISFWSKDKKETGQTLSMIAIATHMAVEHNYKILIIDTNFNNTVISDCYWNAKEEQKDIIKQMQRGKVDIDTGINGLSKVINSGKDSEEIIGDYTRLIFKGRLETLLIGKIGNQDERKRITESFVDIVKLANRYYDYVFVDLQKGLDVPFITEVLEISNLVVVNLTQRLKTLDDFLVIKQTNPLFKSKKILPIIGRYDKNSKYTKRNVARYIGEKKELPAIPFNTLFYEAASEGTIRDYFLKFRKSLISSSDRNAMFIQEVENASDRIEIKIQELQMMM